MKKILILICLVLCISCGKNKKIVLNSTDVYNEAMKLLENKRYSLAGEKFESIEENFVIDKNVNKALVLSAYSYYMGKKYTDSNRIIKIFKEKNLVDENMEYMDYLYIMNNSKLASSTFKSIENSELVYEKSVEFLNNYINSEYKENVENQYYFALNNLALNELNTARFNIENHNILGALTHLKNIENKYSNVKDTKILNECYFLQIKIYEYLNLNDQVEKYKEKLI